MIVKFFFGAVTGAALVASGMIAASAIFPLQGARGSQTSETADPAVAEADATQEVAEPEPVPEPEPADSAPTETVVAEVDSAEAEAETEALAEAETEAPEVAVEASDALAEAADPVIAPTQPDVTEATAVVPEAADDEQAAETPAVAEVTAPATPEPPAALPAPAEDQAAAVDATEATSEAEPTPEPEAAVESEPAPEPEPEIVVEPEAGSDTEAQPDAVAEVQPEPADGAEPDAAGDTQPDAAADPQAEAAAESPAPSDEAPDAGTGAEAAGEDSGSTFAPAPGFASEGVIADPADEPAADSTDAGATDAAAVDLRPIAAFAAAFENPDAKPVLAIVLIDRGAADIDRAALAALPFPVSFALDPMHPAASEQAAIYRAAGREVIMLATGIAEGSQASDIEVAFQSMSQRLPEAVAVMDLAVSVFQDNRPLASLVVPVIGAEGRGVLSWDKGLNAADQVARRDDIASAVIFRDLAVGGGDAAAAKRTLDRAVFKAGQDGRVVVAGDITPALVTALLEWSVEGRVGAVALGPVTAVLQVD